MAEELSIEDAKTLLALCASGRLYAVEAWIGSGRSLQVPRALRKTPLQVAFATGFHSLIELLLRHAPNQQTKNEALSEAVHRRRSDLIDLALTYGAEIGTVPFVDVLGTADKSVVSTFLSRGADPVTGFPFAHAIRELKAKTTLGMYLDCRRQYPELAGKLQQQADMALRQFSCDGNLKWVSLLLWAGADPRSPGPLLEHAEDEHAQDPETHTTAFDEACTWGHTEILKRLNRDRGGARVRRTERSVPPRIAAAGPPGAGGSFAMKETTRQSLVLLLFVPLIACGGGGSTPTSPTPAQSFLAGTWRGTMTIQPDPTGAQPGAPVSGTVTWVFEVVPQTNLQSFRTTIRSENGWLPITLTSSTSMIPGNTAPAQISTQGEYDSPRGCRGTFGSFATAEARSIQGSITGVDCPVPFTGSVTLTKE